MKMILSQIFQKEFLVFTTLYGLFSSILFLFLPHVCQQFFSIISLRGIGIFFFIFLYIILAIEYLRKWLKSEISTVKSIAIMTTEKTKTVTPAMVDFYNSEMIHLEVKQKNQNPSIAQIKNTLFIAKHRLESYANIIAIDGSALASVLGLVGTMVALKQTFSAISNTTSLNYQSILSNSNLDSAFDTTLVGSGVIIFIMFAIYQIKINLQKIERISLLKGDENE